MNKVVTIGRLTKDIELKQGNQTSYAYFAVACDRIGAEGTDFPRFKVFGKQAENMAKYVGKGSMVAVEGHIHTSSYEKDGEKMFSSENIADKVQFLSFKESEE